MSPNETVTTHEITVSPGKDLRARTIVSRFNTDIPRQPAVYPYITGKADRVDVVVEYEEDGTRVHRHFSPEELVQIAKLIVGNESWSTKPPKEAIQSFTVNVDFGKLLKTLGINVVEAIHAGEDDE